MEVNKHKRFTLNRSNKKPRGTATAASPAGRWSCILFRTVLVILCTVSFLSMLLFPLGVSAAAATQLMREIVFVDGRVPEGRQLVQGLQRQRSDDRVLDIVALQADEDGVAQIGETLSRAQDLRAIHIISHGDDGVLQLGDTRLDNKWLARNAQVIADWGSAFTTDADLLLYGCNVARGAGGKAFVRDLARLTGASVAASTDFTGQSVFGGNWTLEYATDRIETSLVIKPTMQQAWVGLLIVTTVNAVKDTYIKKKKDDENYGAATELIIDRESTDLHRALLQFDFSSLPAGASINSATLKMHATQVGGDLSVAVYEVLQSWSEGTEDGDPGEANWNNRMVGTPWSTAGGSFDPTAVATIFDPDTGQHAWNVTSLVQAWVAGTKTNNGLMVASPDGGGNRTVTYSSREGATVPFLEINFGSTISGNIFEDANFAGTAAEYDGGINDLALANADVELYNNSDTYITSVTTDGSGGYSFTGLADGTYKVRVRSATIGDDPGGPDETAPKGGFNACVAAATCAEPLPEMTWGNGIAMYGGQSPTVDDSATGDNAGPGDTYVTITVSGGDVSGVNLGFAYNLIINSDDDSNAEATRSNQGTLRQFIKNANAIGNTGTSANYSRFRIGGGGLQTIAMAAGGFPMVTDPIILDATTQPGYSGTPLIQLNGTGATGATAGLALRTSDSTIRGFIVHSFPADGIEIDATERPANDNVIQNNWVGIDDTAVARPNAGYGIMITGGASGNQIGGTGSGEANVIANNTNAGVAGQVGTGNLISGNSIFDNGGLGIDLNVDGVTANDTDDTDTGPNELMNFPIFESALINSSTNTLILKGFARPGSIIEFFIAAPDPTGFGEGQTYLVTLAEGSVDDLDNTTGSYSDLQAGSDTTNRFHFEIPVPGGVGIGTLLTATATDGGNNTSEFSGNATTVDMIPDIIILKYVVTLSDPVNGTTNPKAISRANVLYTIAITNQGPGAADSDTVMVTDAIPVNTSLFVGDLDGSGSPVQFIDGATSCGLTYTFIDLSSAADDVEFSNDDGASYDYDPGPDSDADGFNSNVTHLRVRPKGVFSAASGGNNPSFELKFKVRVE